MGRGYQPCMIEDHDDTHLDGQPIWRRPDAASAGICQEAGGLSDTPLRQVRKRQVIDTGRAMPLISSNGIENEASMRLEMGDNLIQLYSALIYKGLSLGARIAEGLGLSQSD